MSGQELANRILMASVFVLVFCAWSACVILWVIQYVRQQNRVRRRLGIDDTEAQKAQALQLWREGHRTGDLRRLAARQDSLARRLARLRTQAGWKMPAPAVFLLVMAAAAVALTAALILGGGVWLGLAATALVVSGFWTLTERRIAARIALFERQFVDSLGIAARALRAGHPLVGAFQLISEEVEDPVGGLFGEICQEQALGLDLQDSLQRVANASHNVDLKLFATAVRIQMTSGGNLAELMDTLATVMRSRTRLHRRIRVLTAQTQMSKRILVGLPVLLFVLLNMVAPIYMEAFYKTWTGRYMLAGTVTGILLGMWLMRKLSILRY